MFVAAIVDVVAMIEIVLDSIAWSVRRLTVPVGYDAGESGAALRHADISIGPFHTDVWQTLHRY